MTSTWYDHLINKEVNFIPQKVIQMYVILIDLTEFV